MRTERRRPYITRRNAKQSHAQKNNEHIRETDTHTEKRDTNLATDRIDKYDAATHRKTKNTLGSHIQKTRERKKAATHRTREKHEAATHTQNKRNKESACLSANHSVLVESHKLTQQKD